MNYRRIMELAETLREMEKDAPEAFATFSQLSNFCIEIEPGDHQQQGGPLTIYEWVAAIYGNPEDLNKGNESEIAMNALGLDTDQASDLFFQRYAQADDAAMMLMHLALTGEVETNIVKLRLIDEHFQHLDIENIHFMADFFEQGTLNKPIPVQPKVLGRGHVQRPGAIQRDSEGLQMRDTRLRGRMDRTPTGKPRAPRHRQQRLLHRRGGHKRYRQRTARHPHDAHYDLFAGDNYDSKPEAVARTLRHLADTGTVVWQFPEDFPEGMTRERGER